MANTATLSTDEFYTDIPIGEILRRARVKHGLTIAEAEMHLHIRAQHLEALEKSDFESLPGQVYVVGFIRTYAEFLGLDGARIIHVLKRQARGLGTPQSLNAHILPSDNRLPRVSVVAATIALFLLLVLMWIAYQNSYVGSDYVLPAVPLGVADLGTLEKLNRSNPNEEQMQKILSLVQNLTAPEKNIVPNNNAAPIQTPVGLSLVDSSVSVDTGGGGDEHQGDVSPAVMPKIPAGEGAKAEPRAVEPGVADARISKSVLITLLDDSWIELRAPDGTVAQARLYKKGETFKVGAGDDQTGRAYTMTVNNAAAVQIAVEGKILPPLGAVGQVRRNVSLNPQTLKILMGM